MEDMGKYVQSFLGETKLFLLTCSTGMLTFLLQKFCKIRGNSYASYKWKD